MDRRCRRHRRVPDGAVNYMRDSDGLTIVNPAQPGSTYLMVFLMIALDAAIPIFPGGDDPQRCVHRAAEGTLELVPVIGWARLVPSSATPPCSGWPDATHTASSHSWTLLSATARFAPPSRS